MAEETNPPVETQPQPEEQPMMTFTQLEEAVNQAKEQAPEDKGLSEQPLGQEEPQTQPSGQVTEDPVAKALAESGFKSVEELVKSQKEGHATITKLSQERAALQRDMEALAAFPKMLQQQMGRQLQPQPQQPPQGQPDSLTLELFKDMAPLFDQLVEIRLAEKTPVIVDQKLTMRELDSKVAAKRAENPEEFEDLRPIMMSVLKDNPHYEALPNGLDVVYEKAKEVRDSRIANMAAKLFGTSDVDKVREAIKAVMSGQQPPVQAQEQPPAQQAPPVNPSAYVPPAGANTPPMTQKTVNYDSEIATRMRGKITPDMVDEITELAWQKALSQAPTQTANRPRR